MKRLVILLVQLLKVINTSQVTHLFDPGTYMNGLTPEGYATASLTLNASKVEDAGSTFAASSPLIAETEPIRYSSGLSLPRVLYSPQCQPWDSCLGRCGEPMTSIPFTCSCDEFCASVGDCCGDYVPVCASSSLEISEDINFQCVDDFYPSLPTVMVSSCSAANKWTKLCNNKMKINISTSKMVIGSDSGIVYKNSHCAQCNGESYFSNVDEKEIANITKRLCFKSIDFCPETNDNQILETLCRSVSGMVVPLSNGSALQTTQKRYKNIYCALCNGEETKNIGCPVWMTLNLTVKRLLKPRKSKSGLTTTSFKKIPASFSILLNFGLDGKERMMFSSERDEYMKKMRKKCELGQIWDPFSKVCRKLYCGIEYVLEDFKCVKNVKEDLNDDGVNTKSVKVTMNFKLQLEEYLYLQHIDVKEELRNDLSELFKIDPDRIRDMNVTVSKPEFLSKNIISIYSNTVTNGEFFLPPVLYKAEFAIHEAVDNTTNNEPSLDHVLSTMAHYISDDSFYVGIGNVSSKVSNFHHSNTALKTWCGPDSGGVQAEYWNEDFTLILNEDNDENKNWINGVFINKTGKSYKKGQFIANILFQGHSFHDKNINVSGVVVVCEVSNTSCVRLKFEYDEYEILPNGTLEPKGVKPISKVLQLDAYEFSENGSVLVCCNSEYLNNLTRRKTYMILKYDPIQEYLSLVLTCISIVALILILITYISFPVLRNFPGWNTMNLSGSLLAMQITFLSTQRQSVTGNWCQFSARLVHYEILVTFFWMNVMAYDVYKTFGEKNVVSHIQSKREYCLKYILYAYGMPMVIVIIASIMEIFNSPFSPKYGSNGNACWIHNRNAAIVFFAVPLALILLINLVLYTKTILSISEIRSFFRLHSKKPQAYSEATLYVRLATVMGFTWAFGLAAAWLPGSELLKLILIYLFIIFNTLQGVFIFLAFMCNKTVTGLYKACFLKYKEKSFPESVKIRKLASFIRSLSIMSTFSSNLALNQQPSNKIIISRESSSFNGGEK